MQNDTHFFMVWAHRSAGSIFGAASSPVVRNGVFLCFESEERARAESDRLNARAGGSHVHYSVKPTPVQMALPRSLGKGASSEPQFACRCRAHPAPSRPAAFRAPMSLVLLLQAGAEECRVGTEFRGRLRRFAFEPLAAGRFIRT